jgi:hypothetical protein
MPTSFCVEIPSSIRMRSDRENVENHNCSRFSTPVCLCVPPTSILIHHRHHHHHLRIHLSVSHASSRSRSIYFLLNEQPSVRRALPPVGWHRTCEQPWQTTTDCACEKTVVMVKQPGHLTSMKKERGAGTRVLSLCLRASAAGVGLSRSTART